jgi:hypothetical protein
MWDFRSKSTVEIPKSIILTCPVVRLRTILLGLMSLWIMNGGIPPYGGFISNSTHLLIIMNNDLVLFLISIGVLVLYLVFSALTEMGTKLPWKK